MQDLACHISDDEPQVGIGLPKIAQLFGFPHHQGAVRIAPDRTVENIQSCFVFDDEARLGNEERNEKQADEDKQGCRLKQDEAAHEHPL